MRVAVDVLDFHVESRAGLAGDERIRQGTQRTTWPLWPRFDPRATVGWAGKCHPLIAGRLGGLGNSSFRGTPHGADSGTGLGLPLLPNLPTNNGSLPCFSFYFLHHTPTLVLFFAPYDNPVPVSPLRPSFEFLHHKPNRANPNLTNSRRKTRWTSSLVQVHPIFHGIIPFLHHTALVYWSPNRTQEGIVPSSSGVRPAANAPLRLARHRTPLPKKLAKN